MGTVTKRSYSDAQRDQAIKLAQDVGVTEAAKRAGVPKGTLASWLNRAGMQTTSSKKDQLRGLEMTVAQRRARLSDKLLAHAEWLADRTVEPTVKDADRGRIAVAAAVFVDKHQLMTGGVTSRGELDLSGPGGRLAAVHDLRDAVQRRSERAEDTG